MEAATHEHEIELAAELATLYGGFDDAATPHPLLVQRWEEGAWDEDSPLDAEIFVGLLRLAP